jgi:predicted transcriptional regulator
MIQELNQIKRVRKFLGLSQHDLAVKSGVSQSLIAKIEAGVVEPTYTKAKKIFDTLTFLKEQELVRAKDVMNTSVISVSPEDSVKEAIALMKNNGISQLPVVKEEKIVGVITERSILAWVSEGNVEKKLVEEVMDDCPPIISPQTTRKTIITLLKEYPFLIVSEKGTLTGVISRTDMLEE